MSGSRLSRAVPMALLAQVAAPCFAQQAAVADLTGSATLGVRAVDVTGTETKYKEDVNLDDGVRLFDLSLSYVPSSGGDDRAVDRIELAASNLGGDPFESMHFGVRKHGAYDLSLDHRRSAYFYEDTILPAELASVSGSTGGDFHHFDFERVRDTADLDIQLSPASQLSFGLERQTRTGDSTTTLDIERDEFELDRPLDESLNVLSFGLRHAWDKVTVIFDEELRDFENASELFLPGASSGQNTTDPAELLFFRLDQSYDFQSRRHSLRMLADATDRLDVQAVVQREDLDLDLTAEEEAVGAGFTGVPFDTYRTGRSDVGRDIGHAALDLTYALSERIHLAGGARASRLEQSGLLLFGPDQGAGDWQIDTRGIELGLEVAVGASWVLAAGWSGESRDAQYDQALNVSSAADRQTTDRSGLYARLLYAAQNGLEITASLEDDSVDDPFTLASATDNRRYELAIRKRWSNGFSLSGNHRRTDRTNDLSGWSADTVQTDLRGSYRTDGLQLTAGFGSIELERAIDQLVTAGTRQDLFVIDYDADAVFWDTSLHWVVHDRLALGGSLRAYDNRGSFPIDRDDLNVFADVTLSERYLLRLSYRGIEYVEDAFDAYDASILEVGLRLSW